MWSCRAKFVFGEERFGAVLWQLFVRPTCESIIVVTSLSHSHYIPVATLASGLYWSAHHELLECVLLLLQYITNYIVTDVPTNTKLDNSLLFSLRSVLIGLVGT